MKTGLNEWLNSSDGKAVIYDCAINIDLKARRSSINLAQIFSEEFTSDSKELRDIIAAELMMYILEHHEAVGRDISEDVKNKDISAIAAKINTRFLNHVIDKRRTYPVSPFHAYQRHLRNVISKSSDIRYVPTDDGSFFAYSDDEFIDYLPYSYWGLSFEGWSSPTVPHSEIDEQAGMLSLSRFYWNEASGKYELEYLQPLRELTRFVFAKYSFAAKRQEIKTGSDEGTIESEAFDLLKPIQLAGDPLGSRHRQLADLNYDVVENGLKILADQCLSGLDDRQAEILWRAADGQKLDEIAKHLGEKGPSNIHYHIKKAQSHIRKFWSLWGNAQLPGFNEEDEEEQFIFAEKIAELCKKRCGGREGI
ncbi:MAG: hypothetical protein PHN84_00125 [Desulfuromonadaceae bacterium]|nr:hypothetical protein [Desulfuromonadaceae bacterium]MDD2854993.1 hypothetical protein [Desulfuromonadaceae bacterium]